MQIYVVQRGDSLGKIAKIYNVTVNELQQSNMIDNPNILAVGQALVIPIEGSYYWVRGGDSLWSISKKFNTSYRELATINQISIDNTLNIGTRLYIPPPPKVKAEINAYIEPVGTIVGANLLQLVRPIAPFLTYLAPFSYHVKPNGSLTPLPIEGLASIAEQDNTTLMMVVTNIAEGGFSGELARDILSNSDIQDILIDNIILEAKHNGRFSDVHFDFEFIPIDLRQAYTEFLQKATQRLHNEQLLVSAALAPKISSTQKGQWYEAHDYNAIGNIVDFVVIMTYEWGYSGGPPMPVSPITPVNQVLQYALTQMPSYKIMMGQNLYGYDWTLPFAQGTFAKAISPQQAIDIAIENKASISYDYNAQAPFFYYTDLENNQHIVWFEDARSIQAKLTLMRNLNLRGISYWQLAFDFPQNWLLVNDNINVIKR